MATKEKGYAYRVGYLQDGPHGEGDRTKTALILLGDYVAPTAERACEMALEDGKSNGGVPKQQDQPMVAVPISRWSEFRGTAKPRVEWELTPLGEAISPPVEKPEAEPPGKLASVPDPADDPGDPSDPTGGAG